MTTRIQPAGPQSHVSVSATAARTTAQPARPFQQLVRASTQAIVASAEQAATRLPGGPIIAAAIRPSPDVRVGSAASAPEGATHAAAGPGVGGSAAASSGIDGVLTQNQDQNLYYLELQERISQENRTFTALSNVLKARHETVKNAITNIR